ncbi:MAG: lysylphosphatidylglycerol synthase transmembrane domain-containing protein [Bdellovibrionota bacterium]|nr:MAG: lysylphosphatidylglycerol synthase transmembrane domain-containing protein [Bdellovibrionota bacterium]
MRVSTKNTGKAVKTLFGLLILAALIYVVDVQSLWEALKELTWQSVAVLMLLSIPLILVSALKWRCFIESFGVKVRFVRLFNLYVVGYFVNIFVPSYVGGDFVRSWYVGKRIGQHEAFASTILERYTGLVAMLLLAFCFMWFVEGVGLLMQLAVLALCAGLAVITVIALSPAILQKVERFKALAKVIPHLRKVQTGLRLAHGNKPLLAKALFLSLCFHTLTVVNTMVAGIAVGWVDPPFWGLFVVLPFVLLIGALPVAPSGLGIQEGAFFVFLTALGATPAEALGVGIVLRAKSYVLALIGGLVWLYEKRVAALEAAPSSSGNHSGPAIGLRS